MKRITKNDSKK